MLRMPSPYPARSGTDTTVLSRISLSAKRSTLGHDKEACMSDMDLERPLDDAAEQDQDVIPDDEEPDHGGVPQEIPLEADEADAAEQERALSLDEEDHR
jgi:hypothetical protein